MSKLAHSNEVTMRQIAVERAKADGNADLICENCNGTGAIDAPFSGSDPCCPECDGEGFYND
jgi:DnaJ-class molecular chaperone